MMMLDIVALILGIMINACDHGLRFVFVCLGETVVDIWSTMAIQWAFVNLLVDFIFDLLGPYALLGLAVAFAKHLSAQFSRSTMVGISVVAVAVGVWEGWSLPLMADRSGIVFVHGLCYGAQYLLFTMHQLRPKLLQAMKCHLLDEVLDVKDAAVQNRKILARLLSWRLC
jgi:hypothetical protein